MIGLKGRVGTFATFGAMVLSGCFSDHSKSLTRGEVLEVSSIERASHLGGVVLASSFGPPLRNTMETVSFTDQYGRRVAFEYGPTSFRGEELAPTLNTSFSDLENGDKVQVKQTGNWLCHAKAVKVE